MSQAPLRILLPSCSLSRSQPPHRLPSSHPRYGRPSSFTSVDTPHSNPAEGNRGEAGVRTTRADRMMHRRDNDKRDEEERGPTAKNRLKTKDRVPVSESSSHSFPLCLSGDPVSVIARSLIAPGICRLDLLSKFQSPRLNSRPIRAARRCWR